MTLFTNPSAPMIASVASGGPTSWNRQDRKDPYCGRGRKRGETATHRGVADERRTLKRAERTRMRAEIAQALADLDTEIAERAEQEQRDAIEADYDAWLASEWSGPSACCSDCDDDLYLYHERQAIDALQATALAELAAAERAEQLARYTLDESDLPGYGTGLPMWSELHHAAAYATDTYVD